MEFALAVRRGFRQDRAFLDEVVGAIQGVDGVTNIRGDIHKFGRCLFDYSEQGGVNSLYKNSGLDPSKVIIDLVIYHRPIDEQ